MRTAHSSLKAYRLFRALGLVFLTMLVVCSGWSQTASGSSFKGRALLRRELTKLRISKIRSLNHGHKFQARIIQRKIDRLQSTMRRHVTKVVTDPTTDKSTDSKKGGSSGSG